MTDRSFTVQPVLEEDEDDVDDDHDDVEDEESDPEATTDGGD